MAYSPNGKYLAVGNHDSFIYIYESEDYKLKGKLEGHTAAVLDLDWSADSTSLRSFSLSYDLLYHDVTKGKRIIDNCEFRDTEWATQTCKQGYMVSGIWN